MKVAVIGSGTMGLGIAEAFALNEDFQVNVCIEEGKNPAEEKERFMQPLIRLLGKEKITRKQYDQIEETVKAGSIEELAADADIVVECVFERYDVKRDVLQKLDEVCSKDTIITTNTSSISINLLGEGLGRPILGLHFFNPAAVMKLVEIIPGNGADKALVEKVEEIAKSIGKIPVEVKDSPGFVVNRMLIPMINEATALLADDVASAEGIDTALKFGANHPIGPLAVGDLVGLDVCAAILNVIYKETGKTRYKPHPLMLKLVEEGKLGKKTGEGFFKYD